MPLPPRPRITLPDLPRPRAWMVLLGAMAAALPLATAIPDGSSHAVAAEPAVPVAPPPVPADRGPQPAPAPVPDIRSQVVWRASIAHGTANDGWLENGVVLPPEGPGFYTYNPVTQTRPNLPGRRTATATMVRDLIDLGEWWAGRHPAGPRLGIGDLSQTSGGAFELHASHRNGTDADIRLPRRDGVEGPADPSIYDRGMTQEVVDWWVRRGVQFIFYGPHLSVSGPAGEVEVWPNHDDHLHVRIPDPDGTGN